MQNTQLPVDMGPYTEPNLIMIRVVREMIDRFLVYRPEIMLVYLGLVESKKLYLTAEEDEMAKIWDTIRSNEDLTDFVIQFTREFYFRCGLGDPRNTVANPVEQLSVSISLGISCFIDDASVVDTDTLKMIDPATKMDVLTGNPWYTLMHLVSMCGIEEYLYVEKKPAEPDEAGKV